MHVQNHHFTNNTLCMVCGLSLGYKFTRTQSVVSIGKHILKSESFASRGIPKETAQSAKNSYAFIYLFKRKEHSVCVCCVTVLHGLYPQAYTYTALYCTLLVSTIHLLAQVI